MAQGYSVKEFQSYLKEQVEKVCNDENLTYDNEKQRSRAFNLWIARLYKENNRYIDTDPEDALLGERSDLKIDLFLEDTNDNVIYLIQSEFTGTSKKSKSTNVEEAKVSEFFNNHENLIDRAWVRKYGNKRAVSYLSDYKKLIEDDLINKEELLLSQQNILEKNEFDKRARILSEEIKKYRSEKKMLNDSLNDMKVKNTKKILEFLNPIITNYVEKNSISLVIPKKNIIIGQKKLDITEKIIKLLNDQKKSLNF